VLYCDPAEPYEQAVRDRVEQAKQAQPNADMKDLLFAGSTWTVD